MSKKRERFWGGGGATHSKFTMQQQTYLQWYVEDDLGGHVMKLVDFITV